MMQILATDGIRHFDGKISNGDVDCTWEMSVWQNGFWSVKADFHDRGVLAGDFFFAEFLLEKEHSVGAKLEGSILNLIESRHLSLSKDGADRRVRENWHTFEASGPFVRLHVAPSVGGLVVSTLAVLAAVTVFIINPAGASAAEKIGVSRCDDQDRHGPACVHGSLGPTEQ
jgi:hypothetical protein